MRMNRSTYTSSARDHDSLLSTIILLLWYYPAVLRPAKRKASELCRIWIWSVYLLFSMRERERRREGVKEMVTGRETEEGGGSGTVAALTVRMAQRVPNTLAMSSKRDRSKSGRP